MLRRGLKSYLTPLSEVATYLCNFIVSTLPIRCFPDNCITFIVTVFSAKLVGSCMLAFELQSLGFRSDDEQLASAYKSCKDVIILLFLQNCKVTLVQRLAFFLMAKCCLPLQSMTLMHDCHSFTHLTRQNYEVTPKYIFLCGVP